MTKCGKIALLALIILVIFSYFYTVSLGANPIYLVKQMAGGYVTQLLMTYVIVDISVSIRMNQEKKND